MKSCIVALFFSAVITFVSGAVAQDTIRVGFNPGKAPYVLASSPVSEADHDMSRKLGIEISIFKEVFAQFGITVQPVYMNYERMAAQIEAGRIDAGSLLPRDIAGIVYYDDFLRLHDHAIFRQDLGRQIEKLNDLSGLRILAFQRARDFIGSDFRDMIPQFSSYREIADQKNQVRVMMAGRTDVLITDV